MSSLDLTAIRDSLNKKETAQLIDAIKYSQDDYDKQVIPLIQSILLERGMTPYEYSVLNSEYLELKIKLDSQDKLYKSAGFLVRLCQFILDHFAFFGVCYGLQICMLEINGIIDKASYEGWAVIAYILFYAIQFEIFNATVGMLIVGLKIVDKDKRPIKFGHGIGRASCMIINFFTLQLGHLWMLFDKKKRTFVDIMSGSYVVYNR
jgi:uncharacterized RDD family membrane protein YckC